eukprot:TRINITY_DN12187_c0_g1_i8.p1 TRINITY_DN12187_c0_g1~~TRINITY_DN12187_c0_g1_i8.p1  ORF type:complete len:107 (+),score=14.16 TRINITY_DN12187_c0_g1_i8:49-321(+)
MCIRDRSTSFRAVSISGEVSSDVMEKPEPQHDKVSGIDRLMFYKPEESLKTIIEKLFASPDKRLINIKRSTKEILGVISVTDVFVYVMRQ